DKVLAYARERLLMDPIPLDGPQSEDYLLSAAGQTITAAGLGSTRAMELFEHTLAPACLSTDHPRYLSFIPCAPTREAAAFDAVDDRLRMTGPELRRTLVEHGPDTFFAVVATSGTTNFGVVDDLAGVAEVCEEFGLWLHVDGAYGGAGLAAPSVRHLYEGIER